MILAGDSSTIPSVIAVDAATGPIAMTKPSPSPHLAGSWGRGQLLHVLGEFLGSELVSRPVKLNDAQCLTCIVCHYYVLLHIIV